MNIRMAYPTGNHLEQHLCSFGVWCLFFYTVKRGHGDRCSSTGGSGERDGGCDAGADGLRLVMAGGLIEEAIGFGLAQVWGFRLLSAEYVHRDRRLTFTDGTAAILCHGDPCPVDLPLVPFASQLGDQLVGLCKARSADRVST